MLLYALGGRAVIDRIRKLGRGLRRRARARSRAAPDRRGDGGQPRRPLRGGAGQGREPAGDPGRSDALARELERRPEPARLAAPRVAVRRSASRRRPAVPMPPSSRCRDPGRQDPVAAEPRRGARVHRHPATGSTRPATGRSRSPGLRGHVVLVDFWTYTCINCIRTLPFLKGLYATYHRYGLEIVGVETPEFTFEQEAGNVRQAIQLRRDPLPRRPGQHLRHLERVPERVLAGRVPDRRPRQVRHTQFGEGDYKQSEAAVRAAALRRRRPQPARRR